MFKRYNIDSFEVGLMILGGALFAVQVLEYYYNLFMGAWDGN